MGVHTCERTPVLSRAFERSERVRVLRLCRAHAPVRTPVRKKQLLLGSSKILLAFVRARGTRGR